VKIKKGGVMGKRYIAVVAVAGIVSLICASAFAQNSGVPAPDTSKIQKPAVAPAAPVKVNNTVCPVTGNPVNMKDPVTVEYNGKIYNLCCPMCPQVFKGNPEKYSKIAEDQAAKVAGQ